MMPKVEKISLSSYTGVSNLDLTEYDHLKKLVVHEKNFAPKSIKITAAQRNYAQANANAFTGITASSVSSIYSVVE